MAIDLLHKGCNNDTIIYTHCGAYLETILATILHKVIITKSRSGSDIVEYSSFNHSNELFVTLI